MGLVLILTNSCKKDDKKDDTVPAPTGQVPVLATSAVSNITQTTASCGGNITSDGGDTVTARGVCWSIFQTPTIADSKTTDGTGAGSFTSAVIGLIANTTYYVRAYATNSAGAGYGEQIQFITTGTVTDIDGNTYQTIGIGTQIWMAENLKTTKYRDGSAITNVTDNTAWSSLTTGAYCNYNNDTNNSTIYGRLYNWYSVNDSRNIAPAGWHVPTDAEWTTLENYLIANGYNYDGTTTGNKIAKSLASTTLWSPSTNTGAIGNTDYPTYRNKTGLTALPGGSRYSSTFLGIGDLGYWWSSTEGNATSGIDRFMSYADGRAGNRGISSKKLGYSVRCVRD